MLQSFMQTSNLQVLALSCHVTGRMPQGGRVAREVGNLAAAGSDTNVCSSIRHVKRWNNRCEQSGTFEGHHMHDSTPMVCDPVPDVGQHT